MEGESLEITIPLNESPAADEELFAMKRREPGQNLSADDSSVAEEGLLQ